MKNLRNDQEAKAKAKASLILNKVKAFAAPTPKEPNKKMQATKKKVLNSE